MHIVLIPEGPFDLWLVLIDLRPKGAALRILEAWHQMGTYMRAN